MRKTLIPLLLVALPLAAQTVYSYKDSNGNTVFTEQPPSNVNAEPVKLPSNTQNVADETTTSSQAAPQKKAPKAQQPIITHVAITGLPKDDGSLRANDGTFTVSVQIQSTGPSLPSYTYQIIFDGQPYGAPQSSNSFTFTDVDRGKHTMQANVFNNGMLIANSAVETFTVQRVASQRWKIQPR